MQSNLGSFFSVVSSNEHGQDVSLLSPPPKVVKLREADALFGIESDSSELSSELSDVDSLMDEKESESDRDEEPEEELLCEKGSVAEKHIESEQVHSHCSLHCCSGKNSEKPYHPKNAECKSATRKQGFFNWKKGKGKFLSHEKCQSHKEAYHICAKVPNRSLSLLCRKNVTDQELRRKMLQVQLTSIRYLARQGMAIRGDEEIESNLVQLLVSRRETDKGLERWISERKYLSHDIINEQIEMMANALLRALLKEIREAPWFSLMADETRDVSGKEQLTICIRWVDSSNEVHEDFIGFIELDFIDSATISMALKDVLIRCSLPLHLCRGQAYDGASNMSGFLNGVAAVIKREEPRALYVHCMAHSLNLCLQDVGRKCNCISEALHLVSEVASFIRASPKRLAQFKQLRDHLAPGSPGIKTLCPTRWTVRTSAILAVLLNYRVIRTQLEEIMDKSYGDTRIKASSLLHSMSKFSIFFGLSLSHLVFSKTEELSTFLQTKNLSVQDCLSSVGMTRRYLERQRSDDAYDDFYADVTRDCTGLTEEPTLPRVSRIPQRISEGSASFSHGTPKELYCQLY